MEPLSSKRFSLASGAGSEVPHIGKDAQGREYLDLTREDSPDTSRVAFDSLRLTERPAEKEELQKLGCPSEEVDKLVGRGYIEEYHRHLERGLPQSAAESLLCAMIGQDPAISDDLREKIALRLTPGGTSGVYFLKNFAGEKTFVFKPENEEPFMPAWPRAGSMEVAPSPDLEYPVRLSVKAGSGVRNEVLAAKIMKEEFKLDVPQTFYVDPKLYVTLIGSVSKIKREGFPMTKGGSIQEFKPGVSAAIFRDPSEVMKISSRLYGGLANTIEVAERIAVADLVCGNCDRHSGNLLYDVETQKIYPIDHGLCFPDGLSLDGLMRRGGFINETTFRATIPEGEGLSDSTLGFFDDLDSRQIEGHMRAEGALTPTIEEMHMRLAFLKVVIDEADVGDLSGIVRFYNEPLSDYAGTTLNFMVESATRAADKLGLTQTSLRDMSAEERQGQFAPFLEEFQIQAKALITKFPNGVAKIAPERRPRF